MGSRGNLRSKGESLRTPDIEGQDSRNRVEAEVQHSRNDGVSVQRSKSRIKIIESYHRFSQTWRIIFGVSCVIAVVLDPLFFYVPVINEDKKCIGLDKKLRTISLILRSVTDIIGIINIILQFHNGYEDETTGEEIKDPRKIAMRYLRSCFLIDVLVILPFPQVIILYILRDLKGSKSLNTRKLLTFIVLLQYLPRVVQIYLSWKDPSRRANTIFGTPLWVKAAFNFFLYIIASHVLGALWYFLSIEREMACWQMTCENHIGCIRSSFNCDHSLGNYTFLSDFCPIKTPNITLFDFGIFYGALQSGVAQSKNFSEKFCQCFWWGLRNLSSLGQNLQTSNYVWESFFATLVSLFGLLLFSYFIGNLQLYMQLDTTRSAEERKWKEKRSEIQTWMSKYDFSDKMKSQILRRVLRKLEEKEDVCVENLLSHLPRAIRNNIKRHLCLNLLKQVPKLQNMNENLLQKICDSLNPRYYSAHSYIVREGDPIDAMFFIKDGIAWTYITNKGEASGSSQAESLERDRFFGEELIELVLKTPPLSKLSKDFKLPASRRTVKTHGKVEAFALMARDLNNILSLPKNWLGIDKVESKPFAANVIKRAFLRLLKTKNLKESSHGGRYLPSSGTQGN